MSFNMKKLTAFLHRRKSKEIAKERLKILLISDRINCSPKTLEIIKKEIARVLSNYIQIDPDKMEIEVSKRKINVFW